MAKTEAGKQRLLALREIMLQESDENHRLTAADLEELLRQRHIPSERKSIYRDLAVLGEQGMDIIRSHRGFYLGSRTFQLAELKLLADAVQCSRCITEKKSYELIGKLGTLTSRYNAGQLRRQLQLVGRSKAENESIYYNVDALYQAIDQNSEITFRYLDYQPDGTRRPREKLYRASPYGLCWDSENYYLVAHTESRGKTHYRVDRMADIQLTGTPRLCPEQYQELNLAAYSRQVFGMFGGSETRVRLQFPRSLINNAVDKFGSSAMMIPKQDGSVTLTAEVALSPVFYSWVFSFSGRVKILEPEAVRQEYRDMCRKVLEES